MAIINFINMMVTMALIGNFIVKWLNYLINREENMKKNNQKFAERLKELREEKGVTQSEIAFDLGIKQPTYHQWESEKRSPSGETLVKLADYFDVSLDYLLDRKKKEIKK